MSEEQKTERRSGLVALLGRPNAGKSTLLNRLVGQKVAIVSDKPQTTRYRIQGIRTTPESQIVFVDTPGIHRPGFLLNERMMGAVYETLKGVDVVVHLVDVSERFGKGENYAVDLMRQAQVPVILALNKADAVNKAKILPVIESYNEFDVYREIVPISAKSGENVDQLIEVIERHLPEAPFLYPEDQVTDQRERSVVAEIIREKVLAKTRQEIPYSAAVQVELFDESKREEGFVSIAASIIVEKPGQKKIVIGRGGKMIKEIGIEARKEIQFFLDVKRMYLDLNVKVVPAWRNTQHLLDELGVR